MVVFRPFEERDNDQILDMELLCPQGDENYALVTNKSPDASARYKLYDNYHFLVAEEEEKVVGSVGWAVKQSSNGNPYIYLVEVNVHPDYRRRGIASALVDKVEKHASDIKADHIYCYIFQTNKSSKALFEKHDYMNPLDFKSCALSIYKKAKIPEGLEVENVKTNDIPEVVDLINHYYEGREHFIPYSAEFFESFVNGIPKYGLDNFWVVKQNGEIVACAGLWDSSTYASYNFSNVPLSMKTIGMIFKFLNNFTKMPRIPGKGEYLKLHYLVDHAYKTENPDSMLALMGHINNQALDANGDYMVAALDPEDKLLKIRSFPQPDNWSLFVKSLKKGLKEFNQIYIDVRDCIG